MEFGAARGLHRLLRQGLSSLRSGLAARALPHPGRSAARGLRAAHGARDEVETGNLVNGRFLFEREYVGYTGALTHIARGIDRLAREGETREWIGVDGVWDAFVEQVLRPIEKLELAAQGEKRSEEGEEEKEKEEEEEEEKEEKWGEEGEREAPATLSLTVKQPVTEMLEETTRDPGMETRKKGGGAGTG